MASPQSIPPPISAPTPAIEVVKRNDRHSNTRRIFVGPTPERAIAQLATRMQTSKKSRRSDNPDDSDDESLSEVIKQHAFDFFIGRGGREEDWDEDEEHHVRQEMLQRWKKSDYYTKVLRRQKTKEPIPKWIGASFEVGDFLGVNVVHQAPTVNQQDASSARSSGRPISHPSDSHSELQRPPMNGHESSTVSSIPSKSHSELLLPPAVHSQTPRSSGSEGPRPLSAASSAPLLPRAGPSHRTAAVRFAESDQAVTQERPKDRTVHCSLPEDEPASPSEVLRRSGSGIGTTSAGAARFASVENTVRWGDVVMRGRWIQLISLLLLFSKIFGAPYRQDAMPGFIQQGGCRC
jgi:hypothetical protein